MIIYVVKFFRKDDACDVSVRKSIIVNSGKGRRQVHGCNIVLSKRANTDSCYGVGNTLIRHAFGDGDVALVGRIP